MKSTTFGIWSLRIYILFISTNFNTILCHCTYKFNCFYILGRLPRQSDISSVKVHVFLHLVGRERVTWAMKSDCLLVKNCFIRQWMMKLESYGAKFMELSRFSGFLWHLVYKKILIDWDIREHTFGFRNIGCLRSRKHIVPLGLSQYKW
jgi:hypothetical protein